MEFLPTKKSHFFLAFLSADSTPSQLSCFVRRKILPFRQCTYGQFLDEEENGEEMGKDVPTAQTEILNKLMK
jgi:hypothetical protein